MNSPFANVDSISVSIDNSSMITEVNWNKSEETSTKNPKGDLTLTFIKGERYEYVDVPVTVLGELLAAESVGKFFHENIKDRYDTYKEI